MRALATPSGPAPYPGLDSVVAERRHLLDLGYRALGSVQDAEARRDGGGMVRDGLITDLRMAVNPDTLRAWMSDRAGGQAFQEL